MDVGYSIGTLHEGFHGMVTIPDNIPEVPEVPGFQESACKDWNQCQSLESLGNDMWVGQIVTASMINDKQSLAQCNRHLSLMPFAAQEVRTNSGAHYMDHFRMHGGVKETFHIVSPIFPAPFNNMAPFFDVFVSTLSVSTSINQDMPCYFSTHICITPFQVTRTFVGLAHALLRNISVKVDCHTLLVLLTNARQIP